MSNTLLEAFLKFKTSWQWQLQYGKYYYRKHFLNIVWQAFIEHCLKIIMDLDWPYQNWRKHFIAQFLGNSLKFKTSWQWQLHHRKHYGNYCFYNVWQTSTEHWWKIMMDLNWPYQNWRKTVYCTCQTFSWKHF